MYSRLHTHRPGAQRGAAALIVVLLLFFIISLVAAYAGRNLIFEQRTSTNQYRATQAFEAAEAGLEWALAMLNGGPIGATCAPSANAADKSFRQRFLREDPPDSGQYVPATWDAPGGPERLRPSCIRNGAGWNCSCPDAAAPMPAVPVGGGTNPAFRVCFERVPLDPLDPLEPLGPVQQGTVRIVSTGRTRFADLPFVDQPCEERGQGTADDAAATVSVVVALSSALATPPRVGLAVRGNVDITGPMSLLEAPLPSREELAARGWLVQAGGSASLPLAQPANVRGTPISAYFAQNDAALAALSQDQLFASVFNMGKATYRNQPGAVILNDCAVACSAKLVQAAQSAKGRIIWIDGDMTVEADAVLGAAAEPVAIVASGNVNLTAASVEVFGLLYSHANFDAGVADLSVEGAAVAAGKFDGGGSSRVLYRADILGLLSRSTGSFVRVPGSWRDFP